MTTWTTVPLGDVADLQAGAGFPPSMQGRLEGELPLAKVGDISRAVRAGGQGLIAPLHHITKAEAAELRARIFPPGSTVFAKIGEAISQNYRLFTDREAAFDNNVMGAIPRAGRIDARYLFRFLETLDLYAYSSKTTVPALRKSDLERIPVPMPDGATQRRIADILDKADAIRRKRKEAIALTEKLLRSAFLEMFGDPVTNPKGWEVKPLGQLLDNIDSGWSPVCEARPVTGREWGVLKLGAVTFGRYDANDNKALRPGGEPLPELEVRAGDVLFSRKNTYEHVAACVFVTDTPPRLMLPDLIFRLVLSKSSGILPEVLWGMLSNPKKRAQVQKLAGGTSGSMPNISKERLKGVELPVPAIGVQRKFAAVVCKTENTRRELEQAATEADSLFDSLVHRAFRGEIVASRTGQLTQPQLGLFDGSTP